MKKFFLSIYFLLFAIAAYSQDLIATNSGPSSEEATVSAPEAVTTVTKTKLRASDYKQMVKDYTLALKTNPKDFDTYYKRATALVELKDYKEAIADYNAVLKADPTNLVATYNRALAKMHNSDFRGAAADLTKVIKAKPEDKDALYNRAICRMNMFNRSAAQDFTAVIKLEPNNYEAYYNRGIVKFESADYKGACADWTAIADKEPRAVKAMKKYCK